ncbi:FadR/GntR family transcriptional regulator [Nocardioides sp. cx-173]|uniref:FadR/GntR family transcriptional regulator n=1 Tax=Nocardioides sp. cx-173 TaxID=2898796 RepID=UPI001E515BB2|nr:FadR/GntR family transcriptional regulator [Nocardioides sp. cx-173]MCD4524284.1 FadR family transcriptional regulator [Nocardioides sp. cx-173]UGB41676.1 FadR family transcriptional regulator [Nocardioides sp. cx-173]
MVSPSSRPPIAGQQIGTTVRAPKTAELIATQLRRQIVHGELRPGMTLPPEMQLMEQYGVSRPTLREAFRILEAEALINVRRGSRGGAQVTTPEVSVPARYIGLLLQIQGTTINDVYDARTLLEPPCARLLAQRRTDDDIAKLRDVVEQVKAQVNSTKPFVPDAESWSRLTYRFHELVLEGSGNKTLALQGAVLANIAATHLRSKIAKGNESDPLSRFQQTIKSFTKLIELAEAGDADAAQQHWATHMDGAAKYLLKDDLEAKPVVDLFY